MIMKQDSITLDELFEMMKKNYIKTSPVDKFAERYMAASTEIECAFVFNNWINHRV